MDTETRQLKGVAARMDSCIYTEIISYVGCLLYT